MRGTATVFVIDDDAAVRDAIRELLLSVGHPVESFLSAEEFLARRDPQGCGCLVCDVRLPGTSGLELQKRLSAQKDRIPIIFISGYGDVPMAVQVMKGGAVDFLQKPFREQELLECVQMALRRDEAQRELEEQVSSVLSGYRSLTKREREIMKLVVTGQINKQIAAQVGLSEVTVKIHRAQVMHKMGTPSLADLVRAADKIEAYLS
ncbi:MAG: response regulator transcription factor [Alphaproteobacteria bacterium]|nr:response regulator transcription factor [Alphaproteobacteria bacterium]